MKTLKLSLIGIILFSTMGFSQNLIAKNTTDSSATTLRNELIKMIQKPDLRNNGITNAEVKIQFTIGEKGEINIVKIDTESEYLNSFIRNKLKDQTVSTKDIRKDKVYFLKIEFELA